MQLGLFLIVLGLIVGVFLHWTLGLILVAVGILCLFLPSLR